MNTMMLLQTVVTSKCVVILFQVSLANEVTLDSRVHKELKEIVAHKDSQVLRVVLASMVDPEPLVCQVVRVILARREREVRSGIVFHISFCSTVHKYDPISTLCSYCFLKLESRYINIKRYFFIMGRKKV